MLGFMGSLSYVTLSHFLGEVQVLWLWRPEVDKPE